MDLRKITKDATIAGVTLLIAAGGALSVPQSAMKACCMMAESDSGLVLHMGPCGCGCGEFEKPQIPDQTAAFTAISENSQIPTKFVYIIENENAVTGDLIPRFIEREYCSLPPPLIPDNKYTPLLC